MATERTPGTSPNGARTVTRSGPAARLQYGGGPGWRALGVAFTAAWYALLTGAILNLIDDGDWAVVFVVPIWGVAGLLPWRLLGACVIAEDHLVTVRNTSKTYRLATDVIERFTDDLDPWWGFPAGRRSVVVVMKDGSKVGSRYFLTQRSNRRVSAAEELNRWLAAGREIGS